MAGFTNYAFRQIVRQLGGVGLPATEMVSARGFLRHATRTTTTCPIGSGAWPRRPRPLAVQIWDNDPDTLAAVGRRLADEFRVSVVDINFGCPVPHVIAEGPERIVSAALSRPRGRDRRPGGRRPVAPTPVTAKIRLGCTRDTINAIDVAQAVEAAGGAALTVHGRTAARHVPRLGRLGPDRRGQAALAAHPPDRQRRPADRRKRWSRRSGTIRSTA